MNTGSAARAVGAGPRAGERDEARAVKGDCETHAHRPFGGWTGNEAKFTRRQCPGGLETPSSATRYVSESDPTSDGIAGLPCVLRMGQNPWADERADTGRTAGGAGGGCPGLVHRGGRRAGLHAVGGLATGRGDGTGRRRPAVRALGARRGPTGAGKVLLRHAAVVLERVDATTLELAGLSDRLKGRLAVGAYPPRSRRSCRARSHACSARTLP